MLAERVKEVDAGQASDWNKAKTRIFTKADVTQ
jgi:hypothetical protein